MAHFGHRGDGEADDERVHCLVRSLDISAPWDLSTIIDSVAQVRGKAIRLIADNALFGSGHACGLWISRDYDDIIIYHDTTSTYHTEQIILHELGHLVLDHGRSSHEAMAPAELGRVFPDLDLATVNQVLGRDQYDTEDENDAELFASLVMSQSPRSRTASKFVRTFFRDCG